MALLLWGVITFFYMYFGILYLKFSSFEPLGAMIFPEVVNKLVATFIVGALFTTISYSFFIRKKRKVYNILKNDSFLIYAASFYFIMALGSFLIGIQYYGGYVNFLHTPYVAIFSGSAENGIKDVLISSSGLMAIFSVLCSYQVLTKYKVSKILIALNIVILLSIFFQGRRETLLLLMMTFASFKFLNDKLSFKTLIKALSIIIVLFIFAGVGLYLRSTSETSGGTLSAAIINAVLFETHFTIANLANEIATHTHNNLPFGGLKFLLYPLLFVIPGFIFSLLGYDKGQFFTSTEPRIYDDKGGDFIFTEAYHSLGNLGVIIHAVFLGFLIAYFYSAAKKNSNILFHFPLVSLILVASRKDIIYGIKYISLEFFLLFFFYAIYLLLPKKNR